MSAPAGSLRGGGAAAPAPAVVAPAVVAPTVVAGRPTAEELAVVVVVLSAGAGRAGRAAPDAIGSAWAARSRLMRAPVTAGPGAWRASAQPR